MNAEARAQVKLIYCMAEERLGADQGDWAHWYCVYHWAACVLGITWVSGKDVEWAIAKAKELGYTAGVLPHED